jgi:hypothetical protein
MLSLKSHVKIVLRAIGLQMLICRYAAQVFLR